MYLEFAPREELKSIINCFWVMNVNNSISKTIANKPVIPDLCFDLIFKYNQNELIESFLVGPMMKPIFPNGGNSFSSGEYFIAIRFNPGFLNTILNADGIDFQDTHLRFSDVIKLNKISKNLETIFIQLSKHTSLNQKDGNLSLIKLKSLEEIIYQIMPRFLNRDDAFDKFTIFALNKISETSGNISLDALEKYTGFSKRQIQRKFAKHVGYTPKQFARVARFHAALNGMIKIQSHCGNTNYLDVALNFGYVDQSHFNHEFKEFTGFTPQKYFSL